MSRVLVTGAGGFIGRHTLSPLLAAGFEVHAVSTRAAPAATRPEAHAEVRWHHADLLDPATATALMREVWPSHLLHLAWETQPGVFWTSLENLDWVSASLALLHAFGDCGGRRAVLAGTCAEYAWESETNCVEEEGLGGVEAEGLGGTPIAPATLYGAAKHGLHVVADAWARQSGVALAWGRVFHVYGPHEHPGRLVSGVVSALLRGEQARCTHGRQVRDFLYAPELGEAFAALLCSEVTGPVNMASGEPVRIAELVGAIAAAAGRPELVCLGALPANQLEPQRLTADVRRLRQEVGWTPSIRLYEGAERTVDWWRHTLAGDMAEAAR
jgi:nucleoside-diphosphate-sugar epimerase